MAGFLVFCRIGACFSFAPGFSSPRTPMRLRLFIALGLTLVLSAQVAETREADMAGAGTARLMLWIARECLVGAALGMMARLVFASLEMMFTAASMSVGLSSSFAPRIDDGDSMPEFASLILLATTVMMFVADLHWEIVRAVSDSYRALPLGAPFSPEFVLSRAVDTLSSGLSIAFRLASPFIAFGVVSNFGFALVNKITPQIAVYFVSTPAVLFSGLMLLSVSWADIATKFIDFFKDWLGRI